MSTSEEIREQWGLHGPYYRMAAGVSNSVDMQWQELLKEIFRDVSHTDLVNAGMSPQEATEFLGLLAL